jgi:hypothetical protein
MENRWTVVGQTGYGKTSAVNAFMRQHGHLKVITISHVPRKSKPSFPNIYELQSRPAHVYKFQLKGGSND